MHTETDFFEQKNLFSVPIWRTRVPELDAHHEEILAFFTHMWESNTLQRDQNGYGYQTPSVLYKDDFLKQSPALKLLRQAFHAMVLKILKDRQNHSVHLPPDIYADMAWLLVQTNDAWVNGPWHDHAPALISGCYYLQQPETQIETEGALAFQRPGSVDPFVKQIQYIKPQQGDFILFPSYLSHRPMPCPSANQVRMSINMDAYVHWTHWDEKQGPTIHPDRYKQLVDDSLD